MPAVRASHRWGLQAATAGRPGRRRASTSPAMLLRCVAWACAIAAASHTVAARRHVPGPGRAPPHPRPRRGPSPGRAPPGPGHAAMARDPRCNRVAPRSGKGERRRGRSGGPSPWQSRRHASHTVAPATAAAPPGPLRHSLEKGGEGRPRVAAWRREGKGGDSCRCCVGEE